jgi:hypothetical protein
MMRIDMPLRATCIYSLLALAAAGCGSQTVLLGSEGNHLLTSMDALALPGERAELVARLQGGDLLSGEVGRVVLFRRGGATYGAAQTDSTGTARVPFVPDAPGDYEFSVEVSPAGLADPPPQPQRLLVACRAKSQPMVVVDMDRTIVASGFEKVLIGQPEPMPDSAEVLHRLAEKHTIVYLTQRPEYFGAKSKEWLGEHGYPSGPVLLATTSGFLRGSEAFKSAALAKLKKRFSNMEIGVGDKVSDVAAYHANGLRGFLILQVPPADNGDLLSQYADELARLPAAAEAVSNWRQIEQALFEGASFPVSNAERRIRRMAQAASRPAETTSAPATREAE